MAVLAATDATACVPIGPQEFDHVMRKVGPFLPDLPAAPMALAVSGGADSMALAWLMRRWRRHVVAFVVDHGLRINSAEEAALTVARLAQMDIEAHVLRLPPFPPGRMQERARAERFKALEAACAERGCLDLLLAHHQHDQDETLCMRSARLKPDGGAVLWDDPAYADGLSGIKAQTLRGRVRVLRPLLAVEPARLRATLRAAGAPWVEDPSNQNRRFERVRWRQDLTVEMRVALREGQKQAQESRVIQAQEVAQCLAQHVTWHPAGWCHMRLHDVSDQRLCERVVADMVRALGGQAYRPARDAVARLVAAGVGALGGVMMRPAGRFGEGVMLLREERAAQGFVPAHDGVVWDGRWYLPDVGVGEKSADLTVGPLGERATQFDARRLGIPAAALRVLPGLYHGAELLRVPRCCGGDLEVIWSSAAPIT